MFLPPKKTAASRQRTFNVKLISNTYLGVANLLFSLAKQIPTSHFIDIRQMNQGEQQKKPFQRPPSDLPHNASLMKNPHIPLKRHCIFRSRLNFSDEDLIWCLSSSKFNLHLSFGRFLTFHRPCGSLHSLFKAQKRLKNKGKS